MLIILMTITTFISVCVDYVLKLKNERLKEQKFLQEAYRHRFEDHKKPLYY